MKFLFMDEKGPQNSFKISKPFDKKNKILYAFVCGECYPD